MKIAVVGNGFVGRAVSYGFSGCDVTLIDPLLGNSVYDLIGKGIDFAFICVPTPMGDDGSIDASIVREVSLALKDEPCITIIKSTVIPSIIKELSQEIPNLVYNPEFLTEKNANYDFINSIMHVFGGPRELTNKVESLYKEYSLAKHCPVYHMSAEEASFVKYGINTFLASKVTWFNEFYQLLNSHGANFNKVITAIGQDSRVGSSHTIVPGLDGKLGFGGACFTKDSAAFLAFDTQNHMTLLNSAKQINNEIRSKYELDDREKAQNVSYK